MNLSQLSLTIKLNTKSGGFWQIPLLPWSSADDTYLQVAYGISSDRELWTPLLKVWKERSQDTFSRAPVDPLKEEMEGKV